MQKWMINLDGPQSHKLCKKSKICPKLETWSPFGSSFWGSQRTGFGLDNQGICKSEFLLVVKQLSKLFVCRLDLVRLFAMLISQDI
jgi:hypothetical protein